MKNYDNWKWLLRYRHLTYLTAVVGIMFYFLPIMYIFLTRGYEPSASFLYIWGALAVVFPVFYLIQTYRVKKHKESRERSDVERVGIF